MFALLFSGCFPAPLLGRDEPFPEQLSELLDPDDPQLVPFEPSWPLWSNGLDKQRWAHVPGPVVASGGRWYYPEGTLFFKTFSWEGQPVETRAMRRTLEGWDYGAWLWEGDDATLLPMIEGVSVEGLDHAVPSRFQCRVCHEAGEGVLGFSPLQLADPEALGVFHPSSPPQPLPITGHDPQTTEVLGYLVGNCVHCHDGAAGTLNSFDLRPDVALSNLVGVPTESSASASGLRVAPGAPADSVMFLAISGEHADPELRTMPPLGVQRRDVEAVSLLRDWIGGL